MDFIIKVVLHRLVAKIFTEMINFLDRRDFFNLKKVQVRNSKWL